MPNVTIEAKTATDLFAETGIAAFTNVVITNITSTDIRIAESEAGLQNDYVVLAPYEQLAATSSPALFASSISTSAVNVKGV